MADNPATLELLCAMAFQGGAPFFGQYTGWSQKDNAVLICAPSTGHTYRPVAFCDTVERAALIAEAVNFALSCAGCEWKPKGTP